MQKLLLLLCLVGAFAAPGCTCGYGGLCRVYSQDPSKAINAEPCSCQAVSGGIYKSTAKECNTLVTHCRPGMCKNGGICYEAFGTHVCDCAPGWHGMNCELLESTTEHSKFIYFWYVLSRQSSERQVFIGLGQVSRGTYVRAYVPEMNRYKVQDLNRTSYETVINLCRSSSPGDPACELLTKLWAKTKYYYVFSVSTSIYSDQFFVKDNGVNVGSSMDIELKVLDLGETVEEHSGRYRFFIDFGEKFRSCPFSVDFTGCSSEETTAPMYTMASPITLAVSLRFSVLGNTRTNCVVRYKKFEWTMITYVEGLHPYSIANDLGTGDIIVFNPLNMTSINVSARKWISLKIGLQGILGVKDFYVPSRCYIKFVLREFVVLVNGLSRSYICGEQVVLKAFLKYPEYSKSELRYTWTCSVCGRSGPESTLNLQSELQCNREYSVRVLAQHPWAKTTSTFEGTFRTTMFQNETDIRLTCLPSCIGVNQMEPLTIIAQEIPQSTGPFIWSSTVDMDKVRDTDSNNNVLLIKPGTLPRSQKTNFAVHTRFGKKLFYVETICSPNQVHCDITPFIGNHLRDTITVTCTGDPADTLLSYVVTEGITRDVVAISSYPTIKGLQLSSNLTQITIVRHTGCADTLYFNLTLNESTPNDWREAEGMIPQRIESLEDLLNEKSNMLIVREIDAISKLRKENQTISLFVRIRLMYYLVRVEKCPWVECVHKMANSVRRLCSEVAKAEVNGIEELILSGSRVLQCIVRNVDYVIKHEESMGSYSFHSLFTAILQAFSAIVRLYDPIIFSRTSLPDVRQMHFRKVQEGNNLARKVVEDLGVLISARMPHPSVPFEVASNTHDRLFVICNRPFFVNRITRRISSTSTNFQFSAEAMAKINKSDISVAMVAYSLNYFWWVKPPGATGPMIEVHVHEQTFDRFTNKTIWRIASRPQGPFIVHIKPENSISTMVEGMTGGPQSNSTRDMDKSVNVHRIITPKGHGAVSFVFPDTIVGRLQAYVNVSPPDYEIMSAQPVLNKNRIIFKYYDAENSVNIYLGILHESDRGIYSFNLSLIRCVTRIDNIWMSENCEVDIQNETGDLVCKCSHMSLISMEILVPFNTLYTEDMYLFTQVLENWYNSSLVLVVMLFFFFLTVYGAIKDRKDEHKKTVIYLDDNYPCDCEPYLIAVYTGERCSSGTSANVALRLIGTHSISRVHILTSKKHSTLQQAKDDWYIMYTDRILGPIIRIELWHDGIGYNTDWFCTKVIVYDLKNNDVYEFPVSLWLSAIVYESHGEQSVVANSKKEEDTWRSRIFIHVKAYTHNEHNWASIFTHHPRSIYTRRERACIAIVVIFVAILTSLMFYKSNNDVVDIPIVSYSISDFYTSLYSAVITLVAVAPTAFLFARGKNKLASRYIKSPATKKIKTEASLGDTQKLNFTEKVVGCCKPSIEYLPIMTMDQYLGKKKSSNYWILMAWVVSFAVILVSSIVIISYGLKFGKKRSFVWVLSFIMGLLCESFLVEPTKILIIAFSVALLFNKSTYDHINVQVEYQRRIVQYEDLSDKLYAALQCRLQPMYKPPLSKDIKMGAALIRRSNATYNILFNAGQFILLAIAILVLILNMAIRESHLEIQQLQEHLTRSKRKGASDLDSVRDEIGYFNYTRTVLLPSLHYETWYNGKYLPREVEGVIVIRGFVAEYASKLIGVPHIRQQRVSGNFQMRILPIFRNFYSSSYGELQWVNEDQGRYGVKWSKAKNDTDVRFRPEYNYSSDQKTLYDWTMGPTFKWYSGGGYAEHLYCTEAKSQQILIDLIMDGWIDNATRVILITFNLYNANINKVAMVTVITECLPAGVYLSQMQINVASLSNDTPNENAIVGSSAAVFLILIVFTARSLLAISKDGLKHFVSSSSGAHDILLALVGFFKVSSFARRYLHFSLASEQIDQSARDEHTSLQSPFLINNASLIGTGVFSVVVVSQAVTHFRNLELFKIINQSLERSLPFILISYIFMISLGYPLVLELCVLQTVTDQNIVFMLKELTKIPPLLCYWHYLPFYLSAITFHIIFLGCCLAVIIVLLAKVFAELVPVKRIGYFVVGSSKKRLKLKRRFKHIKIQRNYQIHI